MFIVLNCNELAGISDFGEKSVQVVPATRWQIPTAKDASALAANETAPPIGDSIGGAGNALQS
jgi:hypothetical protein